MSKGVVMFHIGRSGSTVLCDMLAKNPGLRWEEEPFEPLYSGAWRGRRHLLMGRVLKVSPRIGLQVKRMACDRQWFGFDVKFYHFRDQGMDLRQALRMLKRAGYRHLVILKRRNYLRKVVSSVVALNRGSYHSLVAGYGDGVQQVRLEVNGVLIDGDRLPLLERFKQWDDWFADLQANLTGFAPLSLTYEEDAMNDVGVAYRKVCNHLGIEPVPVASALKRTNPHPLSEQILNWSEVRETVKGTVWEWMIRDEER